MLYILKFDLNYYIQFEIDFYNTILKKKWEIETMNNKKCVKTCTKWL